ncbi:hypothetical protein SHI21_19845 [Bacteriovorax sp. PP10]|uniref:Uncharacterized protein n=1 Tax=Bacteriovorax antarcticus TaxID=3088717 RepID=A0ABU5W1U0_9BACT|nr:hypothetical protein [Bacteriovorax sp. PP10]MEA9358499.1 hypothetical protein [Bacteriovorax sp. PP10]
MQHKLQFNFLKLVLIMGLLILEGPCFAQTPDQERVGSENPTTNPTIIDAEKPTESPQEEHDTQDLEKLLKRYNTDSEKILKDADKLHNDTNTNEVKESEIESMPRSEVTEVHAPRDAFEEVIDTGLKSRHKPKVISSDISNSVRMALEPLQKLSEKDLLKRLDESTKESVARPYMDQFPNITIFAVRLIKDKESIPSMAKILEDKDRLIWFVGAMLSTILFGFILKKVMHREGRSFLKAVLYFFIRMYIVFAVRVAIVYYFYSVEFTPAAKVFKATFM